MPTGEPASLRDATPADFPAILALNAASVEVLSPLAPELLARLHGQAARHRVVEAGGRVVAFLLAFREGAAYDSVNYRWFAGRFARFLYVDRVVVAGEARGLGHGGALYDDLLVFAERDGVPLLTCEIDVEPPNPASSRFHERRGFREVGRQAVQGGRKVVSLQSRPVGGAGGG